MHLVDLPVQGSTKYNLVVNLQTAQELGLSVRIGPLFRALAVSLGLPMKLQKRRDQLGVSYINVARRNMAEFAPVVERLSGA